MGVTTPPVMPPNDSRRLDDLYGMLKEADALELGLFGLKKKNTLACLIDEPLPGPNLLSEQAMILDSLQRGVAEFHSSIRKSINLCSRPFVRRLNLLSLPDELLFIICRYAKDWEMSEELFEKTPPAEAAKTVQNLRLTCRKLHDTSSHLLLHHLCVDPTSSASLRHLDEVSGHPLIRKGIQKVRVMVHSYDAFLSESFSNFAECQINELSHTINVLKFITPNNMTDSSLGMSKERFFDKLRNSEAMLQAWRRSWDDFDLTEVEEQTLTYQAILHDAYHEYQRRFAAQKDQQEDLSIVRNIAAAMCRMPAAKRLELRDDDLECKRCQRADIWECDDHSMMIESMLYPSCWVKSREHGLDHPPLEMLFQLPKAIYEAGISLTSFNIEVSPPQDFSCLNPSKEDLHVLQMAMQQLRSFDFRIREVISGSDPSQWPVRDKSEVKHLGKYLSAIMSSASFRDISIDLGSLWDKRAPLQFSLESVLTVKPWPNLRVFTLRGLSVHYSELEKILDRKTRISLVHLDGTHLLSGTWKDTLDLLRETSIGYTTLSEPTGAECDTLSEDDRNRIFGGCVSWRHPRQDNTQAGAYIQGKVAMNPLRHNDVDTDGVE